MGRRINGGMKMKHLRLVMAVLMVAMLAAVPAMAEEK
jgi:hypothetical protein